MSWLVPAEVIALREFVEDSLKSHHDPRTEDALRTVRDVLVCALVPDGALSVRLTVEEREELDAEGVPYPVST
jgi:hypothetical protein